MDFRIKNLEINGQKFKLQLWDKTGEERFHTLTRQWNFIGLRSFSSRFSFNNEKMDEKNER